MSSKKSSSRGPKSDEQKYTKPALRRRIKEELQNSSKGGRKGQWSARKSQLLVQEYERQGGGYKESKKDDAARSLEKWTDQNWQTKEGSADADTGKGMQRYLPEAAWKLLSDEEQKQAEAQKARGETSGQQFVPNTEAAKAARAFVDRGDASRLREDQLKRLTKQSLLQIARDAELPNRSKMAKAQLARALRKYFRSESKS